MIAGDVYGKLTAIAKDSSVSGGWRFRCVCGTVKTISAWPVRAGKIRSCGCQRSIKVPGADPSHPQFGTALYTQWMVLVGTTNRRGELAPRWLSFDAFAADLGATYTPGCELVRQDRARAYEPANCSWRTPPHMTRLRGQVINGHRALCRAGVTSRGVPLWLTRCRCGRYSILTAHELRSSSMAHTCSS